jgi:hypothetical protein
MRPMRTASSFLVPAFALCGCTALLGTFEVSNGGPGGDDGGPDTSTDGAGADGTSADAADTGADAKPQAPPGTVLLAKTFGGSGQDAVIASAVDLKGNIILAGPFYSPDLDFGCTVHARSTQPASGAPNRDSFVVKLDSTGACKWVVPMVGPGDDQITGVAVGPTGNVFISGTTNTASPTLGSVVVPTLPNNLYQGFLVRLDAATGNVDYVRRFGGGAQAYGGDVSVSGSGLVVLGGSWRKATATESIVLPGGTSGAGLTIPAPSVALQYGIVAVYNAAGDPQWGRIIKTTNLDGDVSVFKVVGDAKDDILATGVFFSAGGIDAIGFPGSGGGVMPKNPPGGSEVFMMKIAGTGTKGAPVWTKAWASDNDIEPQGIAVDPMGNSAISFTTFGAQDLGGGDQSFAGVIDMALGGYGAGGNYRFGNVYGGVEQDFAAGIALAPSGDRFFTGGLGSPYDFGGGSLPHAGGSDMFIVSFDKTNKYRWAVSYGSSSADYGRTVALGPPGLVATGGFGGKISVGPQTFDTKGVDDILLLVLQP